MKLVSNLDFNKLQSLNRIQQNLAAAPGAPAEGQEYYDTVLQASYEWNGSAWVSRDAAKVANSSIPLTKLATDPLARANHTGTQFAATISNLAATVQAYRHDQFAAPADNIAMAGFKLTGLAAPSAAGDSAEYAWVLSQIHASAAGIDAKPSVKAMSSANVASLSGTTTLDGIAVVAADRVLLTGQTTGSQNGPWVIAAGAWSRPTGETITPQSFWMVEQGTVYGGSQWKVSTSTAITLDTTSLAIVQFGITNPYTAGNGLTLGGSAFTVTAATNGGIAVGAGGVSVALQATSGLALGASGLAVGAGTGIAVGANSIAVDTAVVARKFSANIGDGASTALTVTHNLNTLDVVVSVRDVATQTVTLADVVSATVNTVTVTFAVAPASNSYRATVVG